MTITTYDKVTPRTKSHAAGTQKRKASGTAAKKIKYKPKKIKRSLWDKLPTVLK